MSQGFGRLLAHPAHNRDAGMPKHQAFAVEHWHRTDAVATEYPDDRSDGVIWRNSKISRAFTLARGLGDLSRLRSMNIPSLGMGRAGKAAGRSLTLSEAELRSVCRIDSPARVNREESRDKTALRPHHLNRSEASTDFR